MRYDNWDVILFPKDSAVPIQEFRTACYSSLDEHGRHLPTLTCYIASLPTTAPFRISIHSWIIPAKPSALIESRRRGSQKVVYAVEVIVDGTRVFHGFYDAASKWPQEITNKKQSFTESSQPTSQPRPLLEFPPFHQNILAQRSWDAREHNGRIKVLLSEQLMCKNSSPGKADLGSTQDIVCFAFQHAPQEILEQAGISWPIRNPLYLASDMQGFQNPQVYGSHVQVRNPANENRGRSSLPQHPPSVFARPGSSDPFTRPRADHLAHLSQFPKPSVGGKIRRPCFWDSSLEDSFLGSYDGMSTDSWSTKRTSSHSTVDTSMPDMLYASPIFGQSGDPWSVTTTPYELDVVKERDGKQTRREKGTRQVVVTLRDDQLGQLIEAISPPKEARGRELTSQRPPIGEFSAQTTAHPTPANMTRPVSTRPCAAALARKASYQELQQRKLNKVSPDQENLPPSQTQDGRRMPSGISYANRIPTPHPFVVPQAQVNRWDSDVSMRDTSSMLSGPSRRPRSKDSKASPAPIPAVSSNIKSRKEGIDLLSTSPSHDIRHDQSLLPGADLIVQNDKGTRKTPSSTLAHTHIEDIIDVDAVDKDFAPGHKGGVSSIDSTGRLERKLYSALGEELSFHAETDPMAGVENETIVPNLEDLELEMPVIKRKRQDTLGGERDRSPITKMVREEALEDETRQSSDMPDLCGGE